MITVLVADDHPIVRRGVCDVLSSAVGITVVGEASSGAGCAALAASLHPDVVVVDLTMPLDDRVPSTSTSSTGIDAISNMISADRSSPPAIVVLSVHGELDIVRAALSAGAIGYVLKESVTSDLCAAVLAAAAGNIYLSSEVSAVLLPAASPRTDPVERLSPRERSVVNLIVDGLSTKQIATRLQTSPKTVEKQRREAMRKLDVPNVASLVRAMLTHGTDR
ncbi:response regulator [Subtercola frigoramans]|uniref:DNA-binding NarL/FixJ family response regulator n=1 Tax=Subtercola frigoramans TaxID=120298 RepID=A0ABS2L988_9MICO|nr:response regulator transcription factor [Subtercola frigoramans]MBM7473655.1 DNA-binding NarL/FixJ family response regulator [Subtercola frigoramans]